VPYLEAALLMRAEAAAGWDAARLSRRLYVPERQADELLRLLLDAGLVQSEGTPAAYRYRPATAELVDLMDRLAEAYSTNLVGVTDMIHARVEKRAQQFADAFRWRKDN